jgi:adenylate cyclase
LKDDSKMRMASAFLSAWRIFNRFDSRIAIALLLIAAAAQLSAVPHVLQIRQGLFDTYQRLLPRERKSQPAVVVAVDEESLARLGQWPWPRTRIAELVDQIAKLEPAAVGFDVLFMEPDRLSPALVAESVPGLSPDVAARLRKYPSNDTVLAQAISRAPVPIVLGMNGSDVPDFRHADLAPTIQTQSGADVALVRYEGRFQSIDELQNAAKNYGLLNAGNDLTNRVQLIARVGDAAVASLSLELLAVATESKIVVSELHDGLVEARVGDMLVKAQANGEKWIRWGRYDPERYIPASAVISGEVSKSRLYHKVVLVGVTGLGLLNYRLTPLGEYVPGDEAHLQLVEQIFDGTPLYRKNYYLYVEALMLVIGGFLLAVVTRNASMRVAIPTLLAFVVGALLLGVGAFSKGALLDVATPILAWIVAFAAALGTSLVSARRAREKAVYMFSRFVNPHVVQELLKDESFAVGGQSREVTLLFSDIRNFTYLSERRSPAEIVFLLNKYYSRQIQVVFRHNGVLDKFIGDAMMIFWGAPLDDPDHARNAVACALEMEDQLVQFRADMGLKDGDFDIGIGIHTGRVIVGLIGSEVRREYTAIGSPVNLASRIEGLTKEANRRILVSQEAMLRCKDAFSFELVGTFPVKGLDSPVEVFEPKRETRASPDSE